MIAMAAAEDCRATARGPTGGSRCDMASQSPSIGTCTGAAHGSERRLLSGDVPSPAFPPAGCRFHTRCPKAQEICKEKEPPLEDKGSGTRTACHFPLTREEVAEIGVRSSAR